MQSDQPSTEFEREIDERRAWQRREIEAALREADAGDLADDAESGHVRRPLVGLDL
jgi:predicted transcriptional regulator